jgi:hypothetical protein
MKAYSILDKRINSTLPINIYMINLFNRFDTLTIFKIGTCKSDGFGKYSNLFSNSKKYAGPELKILKGIRKLLLNCKLIRPEFKIFLQMNINPPKKI